MDISRSVVALLLGVTQCHSAEARTFVKGRTAHYGKAN
jgi:hypothetical protein